VQFQNHHLPEKHHKAPSFCYGDTRYKCACGFSSHRGIVGAMNIISAPLADGNSLPA